MADFNKAFAKIIELEGGYIDHSNDPGGATNYGISLRWLESTNDMALADLDHDGDIDAQDIANMTIRNAAQLYKKHWWDKYNFGKLPDQAVANKLFDMTINMGARQAHKLLQRAINNVIGGLILKDDGIMGPRSHEALKIAFQNPQALLTGLRAQQEGFYRLLVAQDDKFKSFINGWLVRANS